MARAYGVVQRMIGVDGCAWHAEQTHESLTRFLIEEAYETVDAIEQQGAADTAEELGDVLYQVLFHAAIAERDGEGYDLGLIGDRLAEKLIARHPHVFGDRGYMSVAELNAEWERLKEDAQGSARGSRHPLEGIPHSMPPLAKAAKTVERLSRANLVTPAGDETTELELGDALMRLVEQANAWGIDPDRALRRATQRFADAHLKAETPPAVTQSTGASEHE